MPCAAIIPGRLPSRPAALRGHAIMPRYRNRTHANIIAGRPSSARELIADATQARRARRPPRATRRARVYVGFDPTADSLHVGSLLPLLALRRVQLAGHRPIVLVGGGTGLIGDPSGQGWRARAEPPRQVARLGRSAEAAGPAVPGFRPRAATRRSSSTTTSGSRSWSSIPFLRDVGKHFSLGAMIARESVKARLRDRDLLHGVQLPGAAGLRLPGAAPSATAARCRWAAATSGATSRRARSSSAASGAPLPTA